MSDQLEIPFRPTNLIWTTYKHFPYKAWYAIGELVDNSTQSFLDNREILSTALEQEGRRFEVSVVYDSKTAELSVADNAMGMDLDELKRAVTLAAPPPDTSGRCEFGMGMKTASSWLGDEWAVRTKKLGHEWEYSFAVDITARARSDSQHLQVSRKQVGNLGDHYTVVTIRKARIFQTKTITKIKDYLASMYRVDLRDGHLTLLWNADPLVAPEIEPLTTEFKDDTGQTVRRTWKREIGFDVTLDDGIGPVPISGWVCVLADRGRRHAGFDLLRRGRVIIGRPTGYRPERIFGSDRNDLINQRLYGEFHMDQCPVNHLKDDFLWGNWGEEFEEKLAQECAEHVRFAREYRPTKPDQGGPLVASAVVETINDEIAEVLSNEEMLESIHFLEQTPPPDATPPAIREAEAEVLRNQQIEPRIIEMPDRRFRIYHPVGMSGDQPYVQYQCPDELTVDIFINDNHPYVARIAEGDQQGAAERYHIHAYACVHDAIATHLLTRLGRNVAPDVFLRYKDQLLRRGL